ncbi:hypothetical protein ACFLUO_07280 [Chloroflexota bacterium]
MATKRKHFYSVQEYASERHFSLGYVRRLCKKGEISAFKEGRSWVILGDQTKKVKVTWYKAAPGIRVPIPPDPPDGLIWDMKKNQFVLIEKYAKEHGYRVINKCGKKAIVFPPDLDAAGC